MAKPNHTLARDLVQQALHRYAIEDVRDGDAQLVVMGAILEVVSNGKAGNGRRGDLAKVGGGGAAIGALVAILKGLGWM